MAIAVLLFLAERVKLKKYLIKAHLLKNPTLWSYGFIRIQGSYKCWHLFADTVILGRFFVGLTLLARVDQGSSYWSSIKKGTRQILAEKSIEGY